MEVVGEVEAQKQWLRSNGLYIEGMAQFPTWEGQSVCPDDGDQWLWPSAD